MKTYGIVKTASAVALAVGMAIGMAAPAHADAEHVIRFSHGMPETMESDQHAYAVVFKKVVESESNGAIEVRILGNNSAGAEREQLEKVQAGINQMANVSEGTQHSFFKPAQVLSIPFLFSSNAVAWGVMDGWFGHKFNAAFLKETGVRVLGHSESGFRSLFNSKRVVKSPKDLEGLKIRTMENPVHMAMMNGLGANPTPISWTEVYTSLAQKVVDGMENPPGLFYLMKFYEHQKYLTVDRHLYSFHTTMINEDFLRSLPKEYQGLIMRAGRMALAAGRAASIIKESIAIEQLQEKGIEVYYPSPEEYAQFRDSGRPPAEKFVREQIGDAWVDDMLKAISEAEINLTPDGTM
jgi:C4-dicarboxylate-binding protein DctP